VKNHLLCFFLVVVSFVAGSLYEQKVHTYWAEEEAAFWRIVHSQVYHDLQKCQHRQYSDDCPDDRLSEIQWREMERLNNTFYSKWWGKGFE
jgi:hypothetical protein